MKSHKPTKEEQAWMDAIVEYGCIICKQEWGIFTPPEVHHLEGKPKAKSHFVTIPLCYRHHREGSDNSQYTSRHPNKARFEARYGSEYALHSVIHEEIAGEQNADT